MAGVVTRAAAVVTGAAQGIGKACAINLATRGYDVGMLDLATSRDTLQDAVQEVERLGGRAVALHADQSDEAEVVEAFRQLDDCLGPLSVCVANASYSHRAPFLDLPIHEVRRVWDVCLTGSVIVSQQAARRMVKANTPGRIVVVGSIMGNVSLMSDSVPYSGAKAAQSQMVKYMARELAQHRITVNCVRPGYTDTPGERKWADEDAMARVGARMPLGRLGSPEDVANAVGFLCSDEAEYISGSDLTVDGAYSASVALPATLE